MVIIKWIVSCHLYAQTHLPIGIKLLYVLVCTVGLGGSVQNITETGDHTVEDFTDATNNNSPSHTNTLQESWMELDEFVHHRRCGCRAFSSSSAS